MRTPHAAAVTLLLLSSPAVARASEWDAPAVEDEWIVEPPPDAPATPAQPERAPATPSPWSAAPAPDARPADPVAPLLVALGEVEPWQAGQVVAADARFARLGAADRARLLAALDEGPQWWAVILNVYPGMGIGSLASRDRRGAWLLASELTGMTLFVVGLAHDLSDPAYGTPSHQHSADGLIVTGALLIVGSRVAGIILPFTFHGRRHAETERALGELPAPVTVSPALLPVAPAPGAGPGAALGLAVRF